MLHPETALKISEAMDAAADYCTVLGWRRGSRQYRTEYVVRLVAELEDRGLKLQPVHG